MASNPATSRRMAPTAAASLALGIMALFGVPAGFLVDLAGPRPSGALLLAVTGLQLLMAVGAVVLGLISEPAEVPRSSAPSARAGIVLGALTLALNTILAAVLMFNYVGNSNDRAVIETEPVILQEPN